MNKDLQTIDMSNVRWIHPGIGKTQSKILDILEDELETWGRMGIDDLTAKVYHPELRGVTLWKGDEFSVTSSQISTVRRAIKALKKRCLIKHIMLSGGKGIRGLKLSDVLSDKYFREISGIPSDK